MKALPLAVAATVLLAGCLADRGFFESRDDSVGHPEALLRGSPFADLVVDVDYQAGAEPTQESLDIAIAALRAVVDKGSITVEAPTQVPGAAKVHDPLSVEQAAASAKDVAWPYTGSDGVAHLHILYLRGTYGNGTDDSIASGLYDPTTATVVLFTDTWRETATIAFALLATGIPPSWLEAEVLTHEIGHALGLVNLRIPALTERTAPDDPCDCHSARAASVMYPGVHDAQDHLASMLARQSPTPMGYDDEDRADLLAFREGRTGPPLR